MIQALPILIATFIALWIFMGLIDFVSELFEHSREGER